MTNARNALPVAIAGGGIGGLAAALALARHGFRSLVLEQAREYGEVGAGLQVAPNALSVLDALGIGPAAKKHALFIERLVMMDAVTGEEIVNIPCEEQFKKRLNRIIGRSSFSMASEIRFEFLAEYKQTKLSAHGAS